MKNKIYDIFYDSNNEVYQVRTQSECIILEFDNAEDEKIFKAIVKMYDKSNYLTSEQIINKLRNDYQYVHILDVIKGLMNCKVLNSKNFENTSVKVPKIDFPIYYSGQTSNITDFRLFFLGSKALESYVKEKAANMGYKSFHSKFFDAGITEQDIDKIIADNDFIIWDISSMNPRMTKYFNQSAIKLNRPWLLVSGMIDFITYSLGPIFHGKETGCYECYEARKNSNDINYAYTKSYNEYLDNNCRFSCRGKTKPIFDDIAASIIIEDVTKYILGQGVPQMWKQNLFINTEDYTIDKQFVLRTPVCTVCNPDIEYVSSPWLDEITANVTAKKGEQS